MLQIHQKIEQARISAGLTQDEMAKKLEISRTTYRYWEEKTPAIDKVEKVAIALGFDKDYFFKDNDDISDNTLHDDEIKIEKGKPGQQPFKENDSNMTMETIRDMGKTIFIQGETSKIQASTLNNLSEILKATVAAQRKEQVIQMATPDILEKIATNGAHASLNWKTVEEGIILLSKLLVLDVPLKAGQDKKTV